ncbi:hypothetical protein ACYJW8_06555 [Frateuria aurantia]
MRQGLACAILACGLLVAGCTTTPQQLQRDIHMQKAIDARYRCPQQEPIGPRPTMPPPFSVPQAERDGMAALGNPCAATW